ncbi:MAG: CotH kinase family protein, partial [Chitinophagales bacterium]
MLNTYKNKSLLSILLILFSFNTNLCAQENFYNIDELQEIRIYFEQDNWDELLDNLYIAGEKERLLASLTINGESIDSVGIRYKGFSSVSTDRQKNPFNIKLDYVINNQNYDGIDKIKLSNVTQDPSFLREVLAYDIGQKYMPSSRANFAKVYINDAYWGLYTNVEAVNKDFISQHYNSRNNAFFKCNPEELDFDGENSNLGNSHGTDTTAYYPYYDIESDNGWTELYQLIDILNENPENIESILNVDRTLWMHAFNYAVVNFDSYIGYAQNYYLYQDDNGQFNPVLWDLNQSFASYRLTDASEHFDGFNIAEAKTIDPLLHYSSVSISPRPLMRNLFENDTYRRMFIAHLRTIIEENFANQDYATRAAYLQNLIEAAVLEDSNKFYTNGDFYNNLNSTVSDLVDYAGITDLMNARTTYLQNYEGYQGAPNLSNLSYTPQNATIGDNIWMTIEVENASNVILAYRFGGNGLFQKVAMLDDGTQNDGTANDGVFGIQLQNVGSLVEYYVYAENET